MSYYTSNNSSENDNSREGISDTKDIFDFDQTISIQHTIHDNQKTQETINAFEQQLKGFQSASTNTINGLTMKRDNAVLIATYHNNPDFIVGFLCKHLGLNPKYNKITLFNRSTTGEEKTETTINHYQIEGFEYPVIISYVPDIKPAFDKKVKTLMAQGKNQQILHLQSYLKQNQLADDSTEYNFYDDSIHNALQAKKLGNVVSHHVKNSNSTFTPTALNPKQKTTPNNHQWLITGTTSGSEEDSDVSESSESTEIVTVQFTRQDKTNTGQEDSNNNGIVLSISDDESSEEESCNYDDTLTGLGFTNKTVIISVSDDESSQTNQYSSADLISNFGQFKADQNNNTNNNKAKNNLRNLSFN